MKIKKYKIGDKVYIQKPLVLGQLQQLLTLLSDIKIDTPTPMGIVASLGEKLHTALAIVLCEEGQSLKDKDVEKLAEELKDAVDIETVLEIIEDFFAFNKLNLISQKITNIVSLITQNK